MIQKISIRYLKMDYWRVIKIKSNYQSQNIIKNIKAKQMNLLENLKLNV